MDYADSTVFDNVDNEPFGSGGGGKSGGGSAGGGTEAANTLRSKAIARFLFLLGEGEIVGLKDGDKSVIINKVPLKNPDNSLNFKGVTYALKPGAPDQTALPGFEAVTSENQVGIRVRTDTPIVYRTQGTNLNAVIATISIPQLTSLNSQNSSLEGYHLEFEIDLRDLSNPLNNWVNKVSHERISGKNTSPYERSYRLDVTGVGPWLVRMRRISPDTDDDSKISDQLYFSHVTEVSDYQVAYDDSAIVGVELDVEQLGQSGDIRFDVQGKKINYPSNYNPTTRVYTGFWNGTFSYGFCNDPAWVLMDVMLNPRYGIGLPMALIDKWGLYQLSQFCSALVPDGAGGTEFRFTFNGTFYNQEDAYKTIQAIASMMRAIVFYGAGAVIVRTDKPMAPEQRVYNPSNVVGEFSYASTANSVRHNACVVQWTNPDIGYEDDYTVYEDRDAIIKYGYNPLSLKAIGTQSRGQAYRQAKWAILTEQLQKDTITFAAGQDSQNVLPGDIIEVADPHWATADFGGRLQQPEGKNLLTFSQSVSSGWTYTTLTKGAEFKPGSWSPTGLIKVTTTAANSNRVAVGSTILGAVYNAGQEYTASWEVDASEHKYFALSARLNGVDYSNVAFDLVNRTVQRSGGSMYNGKQYIQHLGGDRFRLAVVFVPTVTIQGLIVYLAFRPSTNPAMTTTSIPTATVEAGLNAWVGHPQVEVGNQCTSYEPVKANGTTQFYLDRPIDFVGATAPQLHMTLLNGAVDDVANVDNADRPIKRELRYFSSNVTAFNPDTLMVTIQAGVPVPAGGDDDVTPLVWIFSKTQQAPRAYKVISNEENTDDLTYTISALQYDPNKYVRMDEGFIINYDPGSNYSNLPSTAFCLPASRLRLEQSISTGRRVLNASWDPSPDEFLSGYLVAYKYNDDNWVELPRQTHNFVDINALPGDYIVSVRAINKFGVPSTEIRQGLSIDEVNPNGQLGVISVFTDRGDNTFTDRNIRLFWTSVPLTASAKTKAIRVGVEKAGGTVTTNAEGQSEVAGGVGAPSTGAGVASISNPLAPTMTLSGLFDRGDTVRAVIGQSVFTYTATVDNTTATTMASALASLIDADVRFIASAAAGVITITFANGATNANNLAAIDDPLFRRFKVRVIDPATDVQKRIVYTTSPELTYTFPNNQQDFGATTPSRSVKFAVSVEDINGNLSTETLITLTNPAPTPVTLTVNAVPGVVTMRYTPPDDPDFAGLVVYMSTVSGFTPDVTNRVYKDRGNPSIPVTNNTTYYYRYAFIDAFGESGVALSTEQSIAVPGVPLADVIGPSLSAPTWPATPLSSATTIDPVTHAPVTTLSINWLAAPNSPANVARYDIEIRETSTGNWVGGYSVNGDTTTLIVRNVKPNQFYQAHVRAVNAIGAFSAWSTIAPADPGYQTLKDTVAPGLPTGLTATASVRSIFLSWTNANGATDDDIAGVEIWENTTNNSGTATKLTTVNAVRGGVGGWSRTVTSAVARFYWLKSVDSSGNVSGFTASATATPVSIPTTEISGTLAAAQFPNTLRPIEVLAALPGTGNFAGRIVFLTTDNKIYRYNGTAWTTAVPTTDLTGTIDVSNFATTLRPVEVLAALPGTGNFVGRMVFLTTDNKLYRYNGTAWVTSVPTTDLTGTIDISNFATTIRPVEVVGALPGSGNFAGRMVFLTTDSKLYRYDGAVFTKAVDGADLIANSIVAGKIQAGAIATNDLAANAVTAGKIAAHTITANEIAANTITANEIAANTITAGQIAAATITATQIAGNTITGAKIAGNTITAGNLVANTITSAQIAAGTITTNEIAAGTIAAANIAAGAILASKLFVGDTSNMTPDPNMVDPASWTTTGSAVLTFSVTSRTVASINQMAIEVAASQGDGQTTVMYVEPSKAYYASVAMWVGAATNDSQGELLVGWYDTTGVAISSTSLGTSSSAAVTRINGIVTSPATASFARLKLRRNVFGTNTSKMVFAEPIMRRATNGELIVDGAITAAKIAAGTITANEIAAGTITSDRIQAGTITGDRFNTTTSLPGTITVGVTGVSIGTVQTQAADPAARINAVGTTIDPGKILISGGTTLASWRNGADATKIEGGSIAANTILANSLQIGLRGLVIEGLQFEANRRSADEVPTPNRARWNAGSITYTDNSGATVTVNISASNTPLWASGVTYIYWDYGATTLGTTTNAAAANNSALRVLLATYRGDTDLVVNYGRTIIDGSQITTGTIGADRIAAGTIFTQDLYLGGTRFGLRGALAGAGKGALLITSLDNQAGVELLRIGWIDSSTIGFRAKNAAGNVIIDHTYNPIESGADVTSEVTGQALVTINTDAAGVALTGELPEDSKYELIRNGTTVTNSATWTRTVISGTITCTVSTAANLNITALGTDEAVVRLTAVYNGTTRKLDVTVRKNKAAPEPPATGGTSITRSVSTTLNTTTLSPVSGTDMTVTVGSGGSVALTASNIKFTPSNGVGDGSWTVQMQWEWWNGTAWVLVGTQQSGTITVNTTTEDTVPPTNRTIYSPVYLTSNTSKTTSGSQKFRLTARTTVAVSMTVAGQCIVNGG